MTVPTQSLDVRSLLEGTRQALAASAEGVDVSAVELDTPLAALLFDSLMALNFIAALEVILGASDLPFERWVAEHSERADALTVGSLIEWLRSLPEMASGAAVGPRAGPRSGSPEDG